jgi:hypothetical protein
MSVDEKGCHFAKSKVAATPGTYTYLFDDGSASELVKQKWAEEKAFCEKYFKDTVLC